MWGTQGIIQFELLKLVMEPRLIAKDTTNKHVFPVGVLNVLQPEVEQISSRERDNIAVGEHVSHAARANSHEVSTEWIPQCLDII